MGTYLSTPVTDKCEEKGAHLTCTTIPVAWGIVDMQGWRKSMEDAHVATAQDDFKIFGVFDGHGGPEVARMCQLYLVSVLTQQPTWKQALENKPYPGNPANSPLGLALRQGFHALDRIIGDARRRDELLELRTLKPPPGERKEIDDIPPPQPLPGSSGSNVPATHPCTNDEVLNSNLATVNQDEEAKMDEEEMTPTPELSQSTVTQKGGAPVQDKATVEDSIEEEKKGEDEPMPFEDDDSQEAVGQEEAARVDQNLDDGDSDDDESGGTDADEESDPTTPSGKMSELFQRLLNMSSGSSSTSRTTASGQIVVHPGITTRIDSPASPSEPAFSASTTQGGRLVCTLPDHPIHAGATAVVAVMIGKTLVVANAGDSRAVLCRDGAAFPLSYDHKPQQEQELNRVRRAGGFVNQFGRINGNLNLSRSIGDLKYKQAYFLPPADQMITAEPDILQTTVDETDEFIVIGCDGIWDCLSNEQAVHYVRSRLDTKTPTEIGREMLDEIISVDPRVTQGIGGDNMTIMIIDFRPHSRSYYQQEKE